jgi:hypothetical protein
MPVTIIPKPSMPETNLTVLRRVNAHENLDYALNYLYLCKTCPVGTARHSTPTAV